jgi:ATP-binding cassette subfamily G (WHITE) protein 2 (SNQ2)
MDLHDGTATIREALEFSAILRQDKEIPRQEKLDYVDKIIDLLELHDIQDALVSSLGVEQKKRLTIGVELAAKPSLLLFLDEPTSGLDSNSAYSIVRFLKKLASAGQAIVCTIHQPSSVLIQQFDMILALNPGGNTFYFGPVGENGNDVIKYFGDRGVQCPPNKNVAEFILETAAKPAKRKDGSRINWNEEWQKSSNNQDLLKEIDRIKSDRSQKVAEEKEVEQTEFAAPVWLQTTMLTKRTFVQYWRDPSYLYGKLFVAVIIGIFNGFTFYQLGNSIGDLQNRMFTSFLIILIPPTIVNAVVPKFYQNMALWQARELPSRIYGWFAFVTAQVVAEIPIAILSAVLYWVLWYFPAGLPTDSSTAGYVFLMTVLFFLFVSSWGQWICAFAPSFTVISNVLPFFFVMFGLFNGVVRPYADMPVFWRFWMVSFHVFYTHRNIVANKTCSTTSIHQPTGSAASCPLL